MSRFIRTLLKVPFTVIGRSSQICKHVLQMSQHYSQTSYCGCRIVRNSLIHKQKKCNKRCRWMNDCLNSSFILTPCECFCLILLNWLRQIVVYEMEDAIVLSIWHGIMYLKFFFYSFMFLIGLQDTHKTTSDLLSIWKTETYIFESIY